MPQYQNIGNSTILEKKTHTHRKPRTPSVVGKILRWSSRFMLPLYTLAHTLNVGSTCEHNEMSFP